MSHITNTACEAWSNSSTPSLPHQKQGSWSVRNIPTDAMFEATNAALCSSHLSVATQICKINVLQRDWTCLYMWSLKPLNGLWRNAITEFSRLLVTLKRAMFRDATTRSLVEPTAVLEDNTVHRFRAEVWAAHTRRRQRNIGISLWEYMVSLFKFNHSLTKLTVI